MVKINYMSKKEAIEHIRFITLVQCMVSDMGEHDQVTKVNELLNKYKELINPQVKKDRRDFAEKASQDMEGLFKNFENFTKKVNVG